MLQKKQNILQLGIKEKREIKNEEGEHFSKENKFKFYESSSKNGTYVKEVFELLAKEIVGEETELHAKNKRSSQFLKKRKKQQKKKVVNCC